MAGGSFTTGVVAKERAEQYKGRVTAYVVIACIVAATGGSLFGYDIGISGGVTSMDDFLKDFFPKVYKHKKHAHENNYRKYDNQGLAAFTSSLYIAGLVASLMASPVTRKYGRRTSIIGGGVSFLIGSALNCSAVNLAMLIFGRVMLGVGIGFGNQNRYYCRQWLDEAPNRVPPHKDNEICMGINKCLRAYFLDPKERLEATTKFVKFSSAQEEIDQFDCLQDRWNLRPKEWWVMYGASLPKLQTIALKLLSQPCSSSCCERNWSTYSFIHSLKRNRLNPKRAKDLVFVDTNLCLLSRKSKNYHEGETRMWDIGGDEWDPFEGADILEVASFSFG